MLFFAHPGAISPTGAILRPEGISRSQKRGPGSVAVALSNSGLHRRDGAPGAILLSLMQVVRKYNKYIIMPLLFFAYPGAISLMGDILRMITVYVGVMGVSAGVIYSDNYKKRRRVSHDTAGYTD